VAAADGIEPAVPISHIFRNLHPAMAQMEVPQVPARAEANKPARAGIPSLLELSWASAATSPARISPSPTSPASWRSTSKPAKLGILKIWPT
jgi:hypothetical protein